VEPRRTGSGLEYLEIDEGDGAAATPGKTVRIHYHSWLTDGTLIESTVERDGPLEFVVGDGQVIAALDEGVEGMKVGGSRRLIVPSDLAYGPQGAGDRIPPYASLILDVGLLEVR
jgi:FKBP-type peptidyl-prolyl cis-trans isomerase